MGDGAADGAGEGEAGVELDAAHLGRGRGSLGLGRHFVWFMGGELEKTKKLSGVAADARGQLGLVSGFRWLLVLAVSLFGKSEAEGGLSSGKCQEKNCPVNPGSHGDADARAIYSGVAAWLVGCGLGSLAKRRPTAGFPFIFSRVDLEMEIQGRHQSRQFAHSGRERFLRVFAALVLRTPFFLFLFPPNFFFFFCCFSSSFILGSLPATSYFRRSEG